MGGGHSHQKKRTPKTAHSVPGCLGLKTTGCRTGVEATLSEMEGGGGGHHETSKETVRGVSDLYYVL